MKRLEIESRLKEIEFAMNQARANFNMLEGGKSELLFWLSKLDDAEKKSVDNP